MLYYYEEDNRVPVGKRQEALYLIWINFPNMDK